MAPAVRPRTSPNLGKQAWGGALDAFKEVGLPAGAKMRNLTLGFSVPVKPPMDEYDIPAIIYGIQQYVFQRRLRVKDAFRDFDQLRCGRCTRQQFMRGVNTTIASLRKDELEALAEHYTEEGVHVQRPQVVAYTRFVAAVEGVFTVANLERLPTCKVPRAGASLQHVFKPNAVGVEREENRVQSILQKIALLCKTRGIVFLTCFQDCDRSDSISLVTPRYSGKATQAQFRQHFPLVGDFDDSDMRFLAKRYATASGDVNYQALDRDIKESEIEVPAPSGKHTPSERVPQTPSSPVSGRRMGAERIRREANLQETRQSVDIMDKLRAIVAERRLRFADCFVDFDKLRKGVCTMTQLQTVFTVLGIALESRDYKNLGELFCNEDGLFNYREFCTAACEINQMNINSWDMELPMSPSTDARPATSGGRSSRIRYRAPMSPAQQQRVKEIEVRVREHARVWSIDVKRCFQDFDKVCVGHVSRTQFHRIMNMMYVEINPSDADLLCQAYCDTDNGEEFNYVGFTNSLGRNWKAIDQNFQVSRRSKYFDRDGETVCAFTPVDATTSLYPDSDVIKVGGMTWSRGQ